ncbi:MAG TPA: lytic transglycosylase domain-containing protein, partial [Clostridiales bacterium]|nr:lytic transglycosylase domain-containing protein [Clostridiales bacterium]
KAESDFRLDVVSKSGAQGVMQLMPATAKYLGVNDPFDPEQNIMGGSKYIKELLDKYDGDTKLALAAYNAGSNNVAKYGGIPPFKETQNYVKNVMKYMSKDIKTNIEINNSEKYKLVPSEISNDNIFTARAIAMWNKANPIINDEINNI